MDTDLLFLKGHRDSVFPLLLCYMIVIKNCIIYLKF